MTDIFKQADETLKALELEVEAKQKAFWEKFHELEKKKINIDDELLKEWLSEYWLLYHGEGDSWFVAVPKFLNFSIGWLHHSTKGYNIFEINKYTQWIGDIPEFIRKEVKIEQPMKITVSDGNVKFDDENSEIVKEKFGSLLSTVGKGSARIKAGKEFELIAKIIEEGSLPFVANPVDKTDMRETKLNYDLKGKFSFQNDAYNLFLKYGAIGVYWMTGAGKSFLTMYVLDSLKGSKLLVVPTTTLKEQWLEYFTQYAPRLINEVEIITYQAYDKVKNKEFMITVFDESHVLPADTFSKLSTIKTKYRLGLSATPYREDGRTNYIFALTGYPTGLDWISLMKILGKNYHDVNVYIVANETAKISLTSNLLNTKKKTVIFVNEIAIGEKIANSLGIPFIHGTTKDRMNIARNSKVFVASRVMELGVSLKDLEHIIEVDFLGGRKEKIQRTGRLLHSEKGETHDIIMTKEEFEGFGGRSLHGFVEKGFKINLKPMVSSSFKLMKQQAEKSKKNSSGGLELIDELFNEGFFRTEKTFNEICSQLEKRGMTAITQKKSRIFMKLNSMVFSKKLFKDTRNKKKVFVMR